MQRPSFVFSVAAALLVSPATAQDILYRLPATGLAESPDLRAVGDFDGDGRGDFWMRTHLPLPRSDAFRVVSGRDGTLLTSIADNAVAIADLEGNGEWEVLRSTAVYSAGTVTAGSLRGHVRGILPPPSGSRSFGTDVRVVGDLDGDRVRDLAITAPIDGAGRVYVHSGRDLAPLGIVEPIRPLYGFGISLEAIDDVDGDGTADLVIGQQGSAGIYSGRTLAHVRDLDSSEPTRYFGWRLDVAGDADGDGISDVVVGSSIDVVRGGFAHLCSGRTGKVLHRFEGDPANLFGFDVAGLGDIDGDGAADVAVSEPQRAGWQGPPAPPGVVHVYSGRTGRHLFRVTGNATSQGFGRRLARAGDLDGNGNADLVVGTLDDQVFALSTRPLALRAETHLVAAEKGGDLVLHLRAGAAHAGALHLVLGSATGTTPGAHVGGVHLPLNPDAYTVLTAGTANGAVFTGTLGLLDAAGAAEACLRFPALPDLRGLRLDHAFLLADPRTGVPSFASNAVPVTLD